MAGDFHLPKCLCFFLDLHMIFTGATLVGEFSTLEFSLETSRLAVATDYFLVSAKPKEWTGLAIHVLQAIFLTKKKRLAYNPENQDGWQ